MKKGQPPRPTDGELAILRVLWEQGPSTVRQVHEALCRRRQMGYTTVLKLLQIMDRKRLVLRDASGRAHVYKPCLPEGATQRQLVKDLLERTFGGSMEKLVMHALEAKRASPQELARIRELLDELERRSR